MVLTGIIFFHIYCDLFLKEHLPRTQEKLERDCLGHHCERSLKFCDWPSTKVRLFLLTGEVGIVNVRGCVCIGIWVDSLIILSTLSKVLRSFWKFAEISKKTSILISLYRWAENQRFIEFLLVTNTDIHRFLYSLIECLEVNLMYITSLWYYSKLLLEKAKKPGRYEVAMHTVFF